MNKLIRLSKTGIEYGDYAWNFASGCGNNVEGKCKGGGFNCWAYPITQRFAERYPNGFKPTIYPEALCSPLYLKKPRRILCAFMGDLFGDWFDPKMPTSITYPNGQKIINCSLKNVVKDIIQHCPQHTFLFLTKQPQNLPAWSPFPPNCQVGVTAIDTAMFQIATAHLDGIEAKVKYVSIEPLLSWVMGANCMAGYLEERGINQIIIGAQTKPYKPPEIEWVEEIVRACDKAGVKVFLKNNLKPILPEGEPFYKARYWHAGGCWELRQELP